MGHPPASLAQMLLRLKGLPLTMACHAGDCTMFDFGLTNPNITRRGIVYFSDYALHVQCGWRLTQGERIVAGYADLFEQSRVGESNGDDLLTERLAELNHMTERLVVRNARITTCFTLTIDFQDNFLLEILPQSSCTSQELEFWRLFESVTAGKHIVAYGKGFLDPADVID